MKINEYDFELTCEACPEQYDVTKDGKQVGYVRLRWGSLGVYYPDCLGNIIYSASIGDNGFIGCFESDEQREFHLTEITKALDNVLQGY